MASAGTQLASTYELVENILFGVDPKTLLFAQRVSKTWRAVIQQSKQLQKTLFFSPIDVQKGPLVVVSDHSLGTLWPGSGHLQMSDGHILRAQRIFANPFVVEPIMDIMQSHASESLGNLLPNSWKYHGASWQRMLLTQPPITTTIEAEPKQYFLTFNTSEKRLAFMVGALLVAIATEQIRLPCELRFDWRLGEVLSSRQLEEVERQINVTR